MHPEKFTSLAREGFNHIPVCREVLADLETPLSTYLKLADQPFSYLLESAQGGERWGRYSIVGLPSSRRMEIRGNSAIIYEGQQQLEQHVSDDPLAFIEDFKSRYRTPSLPHLPAYTGGLVGCFGYDTVRYIESRLRHTAPPDELDTPDILLMVSNDVIVFDGLRGTLQIITHANPALPDALQAAEFRLDSLVARLTAPLDTEYLTPQAHPEIDDDDFVSGFGKEAFKQAVDTVKEYILAGDVMQVVLAQRMSTQVEASPIGIYRALRTLNPSPYMYFMDLGDFHIISASPEILARLSDREVSVRPLAGTRPRGASQAQDLALERELLTDAKEVAEHLMLVDLSRNDLGRVCQIGSVQVGEMMTVERYSHVMHLASHVTGQLQDNLTALDLLRATLPVGTLSGAPKVRAMEIIDELEPVKRGIFGGAVGYLAWNGNMDTAIAIRTAILRGSRLYIQAGAGIVADSDPEAEWQETVSKATVIFRATAMAERGLGISAGRQGNR